MPEKPHVTTAFCKLDGTDGGSTDGDHNGWIELKSFLHSIDQSVADVGSAGVGITTGRSQHQDFEVEAYVDAAFAKMIEAVSGGKPFKKAQIEVCQAVGDKKNAFLAIDLEEVVLSHVSLSGDATDYPKVKFRMNYGKISVKYKATKPDGSQAGVIQGKFDLRANKAG